MASGAQQVWNTGFVTDMAKATIDSIRQHSDKLHNRWTREFAGQPRHTRSLADLEKIIEKTAVLVQKAKQIPGEKGNALEQAVFERLKLYRNERDAIAEAQYDRPQIGQIHTLGMQVDRQLAVWRRHYAGRDRRSRDLHRLGLVIASLDKSVTALEALQDNPEVKKEGLASVRTQLELLRDEYGEIDKVRRTLEPAQKLAALLAEAQSGLDQYRVHYAKQPRATCSPERLEGMIANMTQLLVDLEPLQPPPADVDDEAGKQIEAAHKKNMELLNLHLASWQKELVLIREARAEAEPRDMTNQLGGVANLMFQVYQREFAGKDRTTRDLQLLSEVCDRLAEIGNLMAAHDKKHEPINRKNIPIVEDRLRRYEQEWIEINKAKQPAAQASAQAQATTTRPGASDSGISIAPKATAP